MLGLKYSVLLESMDDGFVVEVHPARSYHAAACLEELHGTSAGPVEFQRQSYASGYGQSMEQRGLHENHGVDPAEPARDSEKLLVKNFLLSRPTRTQGRYLRRGNCFARSKFRSSERAQTEFEHRRTNDRRNSNSGK